LKTLRVLLAVFYLLAFPPLAGLADDMGAGPDNGPAPYAKFIVGAQVQNGLFNLIRKDGKVYVEIAPAQLDSDFIATAEQVNGLGGYFIFPGGLNTAFSARIIRFSRNDDKIVITYPNEYFIAPGNDEAQRAIKRTFANSVVAVAPIVATDAVTGHVVFDASFLLGDVMNLNATLRQVTGPDHPDQAYNLDPDRTLFGPTKAFPLNVVIDADQTWKSDNPQVIDNVPDPRSFQMRIAYNIMQPPDETGYMPRLADDRIGYFDSPYLNFAKDTDYTRVVHYLIRWNLQPSDPTKSVSPAKNPIVYYLSSEIPTPYRSTIRSAILQWNKAFERIGISDAIEVKDQPTDVNWDPDDIRYNTVLWLTESNSGAFAAAGPTFDPRNGMVFRGNIVIDADWPNFLSTSGEYFANPATSAAHRNLGDERELMLGARQEAGFGRVALSLEGQPLRGAALDQYLNDGLFWTIMHESGHALGLMHNFMGPGAYSIKQVQNKQFTDRYGLSSSVMAYVGINVWPKGVSQGSYWMSTLGPYDYHAIQYGYARIPGARTPEAERSTLNYWASQWTRSWYHFASDEDATYEGAHAIDPRVARWDLTNDPLTWATGRLNLSNQLLSKLDSHWPESGNTYDQERYAFDFVLFEKLNAAIQPEHFIGGEYLSRSHAGDPNATAPLVQVPRADEVRAFGLLDKYVFSDNAWSFSAATLNRLVYSEWETAVPTAWAYSPQPRHDVPVAEIASDFAGQVLTMLYDPLMLERLDDLPLKAKPGTTMSLTDLFDWTQNSIYGDLSNRQLRSIDRVHRSIQQWYARKLTQIWLAPDPGTPYDAQSLARAKLVDLRSHLGTALGRSGLDEITRAHLASLQDVVSRALDARQLVPPPKMGVM
jgi:Met-zincin/Domain of unknown function (DUF5117)/Domain of unknown function (DUF5118)